MVKDKEHEPELSDLNKRLNDSKPVIVTWKPTVGEILQGKVISLDKSKRFHTLYMKVKKSDGSEINVFVKKGIEQQLIRLGFVESQEDEELGETPIWTKEAVSVILNHSIAIRFDGKKHNKASDMDFEDYAFIFGE